MQTQVSSERTDGGARTEELVGLYDQAAPHPGGTRGISDPAGPRATSLCHPGGTGCDLGLPSYSSSTVVSPRAKQAVLVTSLPEPRAFGDQLPT